MIFAFLAQNEHGRALITLIRAMRACAACFPEFYITCPEHRAELDRLYPEHCPDPNCPACVADGTSACTMCGHPASVHSDHPDPRTMRCIHCRTGICAEPVHDNGDYRV